MDVETLERGGFSEERARQLAKLLNQAAPVGFSKLRSIRLM